MPRRPRPPERRLRSVEACRGLSSSAQLAPNEELPPRTPRCIYPALEPPGAKHLPEGERPAWRDAIFDCVEACMLHHKHLWAKTTVDMVVKAMVDRRQNFSEEQPRAERALHPV